MQSSTTSGPDVVPGGRTGPPAPVGPPPRRSSGRAWEWSLAGLLLAPNLVLLVVFTYRPLLDNIRLSFTDWNISAPIANPVGVANYVEWFGREDTRTVLGNTLVFTVATVGVSMALGLRRAHLLDHILRGRNNERTVLIAPILINRAAVRSVSLRVDEKRNQPVSVAIAQNRGVIVSGGSS